MFQDLRLDAPDCYPVFGPTRHTPAAVQCPDLLLVRLSIPSSLINYYTLGTSREVFSRLAQSLPSIDEAFEGRPMSVSGPLSAMSTTTFIDPYNDRGTNLYLRAERAGPPLHPSMQSSNTCNSVTAAAHDPPPVLRKSDQYRLLTHTTHFLSIWGYRVLRIPINHLLFASHRFSSLTVTPPPITTTPPRRPFPRHNDPLKQSLPFRPLGGSAPSNGPPAHEGTISRRRRGPTSTPAANSGR